MGTEQRDHINPHYKFETLLNRVCMSVTGYFTLELQNSAKVNTVLICELKYKQYY